MLFLTYSKLIIYTISPKDVAKLQHSDKTAKFFDEKPCFGIIIVGRGQGLQLESCTFAKITLL